MKLTGEWLYNASHRAKGSAREAIEHEPTWADKPARIKAYWERLAAMAERRVLRSSGFKKARS